MSTKLLAVTSLVVMSSFGIGLAHAQCTQNDIKLKYTEIGKLIEAERAGNPNGADEMMAKMHEAQDQMTAGQINSEQFCRAYDALIQEMKTRG
ncbi:MAG: hypothetical protein HIU92_07440 [Proteobacteria bacterium]|nr:hypothetical protein [Pseudomonadota bacterium]